MIDPTYPATITVGGANSSYQFNAFPQPTQSIGGLSGLLSLQSFILPITLQTSASAQYDISGATATLYITAANDEDYTPVLLASGVLSDSGAFGGGVTDRVTFTVPKSLIPNNLGAYGKTRAGNSKVYAVLSDADTYLEFFEGVNVYDTQFGGGGGATPGSLQINNNNLGVVIDTLDAPPVSPTTLDAYLVGTSPSGIWLSPSDLSDNLVIWSGAAWIPTAPAEGDFLFDADEDTQKRYNGTAWTTEDAKPFSDDSPLVNNTADPTKLLTISAASITTGTTRTITAADADVDMADIAVNTAKLTADETNVVAALDGATLTAVTVATGDKVVIQDVSDTDNIKTVTAQSIADLFNGVSATEAAAGTDNDQTGTTYTLVLTDQENKTVWLNNAAAIAVTIPTNASVAFPVGTKINLMMEGAGVPTVTGDTGVTVNGVSAGSFVINNQYQGATITKRATDTWIGSGDIT